MRFADFFFLRIIYNLERGVHMDSLFKRMTEWRNAGVRENDLSPNFGENSINELTNLEFLEEISEELEVMFEEVLQAQRMGNDKLVDLKAAECLADRKVSEDTARMNFLQNNPALVLMYHKRMNGWSMNNLMNQHAFRTFDTAREAVDNVMKYEQAK